MGCRRAVLLGFFGQGQQLVGIAQQALSLGRQHHAARLAYKERGGQCFFQLLDARGHIGLRTPQLLRSAGNAAAGSHLLEDGEGGEVEHGANGAGAIYLF